MLNEEKKLVGVVTLGDLQKIDEDERKNKIIGDICSRELVTVKAEETVSEALRKMNEFDIGRVIVVDSEDPNKIKGIVTRTDIMNAYRIASQNPALSTL